MLGEIELRQMSSYVYVYVDIKVWLIEINFDLLRSDFRFEYKFDI